MTATARAADLDVLPDALALHRALQPDGIRSVFQPLRDLRTGDVVGYEALTRGPTQGPQVTPDRLFAAARRAGRSVDLDWACRCQAFTGAAGVLAPDQRLFVNAEPQAFDRACPPRLLGAWMHGYRRLRVVVELTERYLLDDPAGLLRARATLVELGWELALDDVGATDATVALLPLLQPDVVKLDRALLRTTSSRVQAETLAAVRGYARASGAKVVAEGIESDAELQRAREVGADWGQGFRLGRPGALPPATVAGRVPQPRAALAAQEGVGRVLADPLRAVADASTGGLGDAEVVAGVAGVLARADGAGTGAVLLVTAGARRLLDGFAPLLDRLAGPCAMVVVLSPAGTPARARFARASPLPEHDPVARDVGAVLLAPDRAHAFHARHDGVAWSAGSSTDAGRVADVARALLGRVAPLRRTSVRA